MGDNSFTPRISLRPLGEGAGDEGSERQAFYEKLSRSRRLGTAADQAWGALRDHSAFTLARRAISAHLASSALTNAVHSFGPRRSGTAPRSMILCCIVASLRIRLTSALILRTTSP